MSSSQQPPALPAKSTRLTEPHFLIVAILLAATAGAWSAAVRGLKWAMHKEPVPWTEAVRLEEGTFKLASLPTRLGHFEMVQDDGLLDRKPTGEPIYDGKPDGDVVFEQVLLDELGIGTALDKERVADRKSNWYLARVYRDTRKPLGHPLALWHLQVYYYTGVQDKVPHVPERCGVAAGGRAIGSGTLQFDIAGREPWNQAIPVRRVLFEQPNLASPAALPSQTVTYYVFSLNGQATDSWERVRLDLAAKPWIRYSYFAKVQFLPYTANVPDVAQADDAARDFAANVMPSILFMLPMPKDVEALESAGTD